MVSFYETEGLQDVSFSRKNIKWGIPIPWDSSHTVYVWADAFLNYLTGLPASPARAASIVALSARRFVCAAIFEIRATTELIFSMASESERIFSSVSFE